jgi:hypothetical protein
MKVENYAVVELRQLLYTSGTSLCTAVSPTIPTQTGAGTLPAVTVVCGAAPTAVVATTGGPTTVANQNIIAPQAVSLTVANTDIGLSGSALVTVGSAQ